MFSKLIFLCSFNSDKQVQTSQTEPKEKQEQEKEQDTFADIIIQELR